MYLKEVGWGIDCIGVDQGRDRWQTLVNVVMNLRLPYNAREWTSINRSFIHTKISSYVPVFTCCPNCGVLRICL